MNSQVFEYKGYQGSAEASLEDGVLHGKLLHIVDLVTYEGDTIAELKAAFEESVNDYLEMCNEEGVDPDKPYRGSFNVRVGPDVHRQLALAATKSGLSMNELMKNISEAWLREFPNGLQVTHHHTHQHVYEKPPYDDVYHGEMELQATSTPKTKLRVIK